MSAVPTSDIELFSDSALANPYPLFEQLRELGPVVFLERYGYYCFPRHAEVRRASTDWHAYSSAHGVGMNDEINALLEGILLCSDPPEHRAMRKVLAEPLRSPRLKQIEPLLRAEADSIVHTLVARGTFDAATQLAQHLPLSVIAKQVGLGDSGRERMLEWAGATFESFGPPNDRTIAALPKLGEMVNYALTETVPGKIDPHGWASDLFAAGDRGEIAKDKCPAMVIDYIGPSLDTTVFAISNAVLLFAQHPDQWDLVRADASLIPGAIEEILRFESPVQHFSRFVTENQDIDGATLPAGSRVVLLYGSANRDPRRFDNPDIFDVRRESGDQLAFGHGEHVCVGMGLARLEMELILRALAARVERFEVLAVERDLNNNLRGLRRLDVAVH